MAEFIEAHNKATAADVFNIHKSSQNFFWHSYWLCLLEDAIRDLGGEYECFTVPYWDVSHDAHYWEQTENPKTKDIPIYNSNLGGEGNVDEDYCVDDETYNCCLKRYHVEAENSALYTGAVMVWLLGIS